MTLLENEPIKEVLLVVQGSRFLRGLSPNELPFDYIVETDMNKAYDYAVRAEDIYEDVDEEGDTVWEYLRSEEMGRIYSLSSLSSHAELRDALNQTREIVNKAISKNLPRAYPDIIDEVIGDFTIILAGRAIDVVDRELGEMLFACYTAGGWPCGWSGKYPEGRIITFDCNSAAASISE